MRASREPLTLTGARCDELLECVASIDRIGDDACCSIGGVGSETRRQEELERVTPDAFSARIAGLDDAADRHTIEVEMPTLAVVLRAKCPNGSRHWNGASLAGEPTPQRIECRSGGAVCVLGAGEAAERDGDAISPLASVVPMEGPTLALPGQVDAG